MQQDSTPGTCHADTSADSQCSRWLSLDTTVTPIPHMAARRFRIGAALHAVTVAGELAVRLLRNLWRISLHGEHWRGIEPQSGAPLQVFYLGNGDNRTYLHTLAFGTTPPPLPLATVHWWQLRNRLTRERQHSDLLLIDLGPPLHWLLGSDFGISLPAWIKQRVPIAASWSEVLSGLRRKTRREATRLINKHQWRARVVPAASVGERFYRTLYRPYIEQRYQHDATLVSEQRFLRECKNGDVLELLQDEQVIGAALLRRSGNQLTVVWTGLDTNLSPEQRQGATDALDLFALRYGCELGCTRLDLGGSRPDLLDGVFRYKRKWGAEVECGKVPQAQLYICPERNTEAVRSVLRQHGFIARDNGQLIAKILLDSGDLLDSSGAATDTDQRQRYWSEGLTRCEFLVEGTAEQFSQNGQQLLPIRVNGESSWYTFWNTCSVAPSTTPRL